MKFRHLFAATILIAITALAARHVQKHLSALRETKTPGETFPLAVAVPFPSVASESNKTRLGDKAGAIMEAPEKAGPPDSRVRARHKKNPPAQAPKIDLSSYAVRPRHAVSGDYLPHDGSLTHGEVKETLNVRSNDKDDWGDGVAGNLIRKAGEIIRNVDDATLDASRKVLGNVASPDSARIRPDDDGVRLRIRIPSD